MDKVEIKNKLKHFESEFRASRDPIERIYLKGVMKGLCISLEGGDRKRRPLIGMTLEHAVNYWLQEDTTPLRQDELKKTNESFDNNLELFKELEKR